MIKILFIDDDAFIIDDYMWRRLVERYCFDQRFEKLPTLADPISPEECAKMVLLVGPDVVIMDHAFANRRELNGCDLIRSLRQSGYQGMIIANGSMGEKVFLDVVGLYDDHADKNVDRLALSLVRLFPS